MSSRKLSGTAKAPLTADATLQQPPQELHLSFTFAATFRSHPNGPAP